jgi:hypothetical protein
MSPSNRNGHNEALIYSTPTASTEAALTGFSNIEVVSRSRAGFRGGGGVGSPGPRPPTRRGLPSDTENFFVIL